jgi:hypothetical protein
LLLNYQRNEGEAKYVFLNYRRNEEEAKMCMYFRGWGYGQKMRIENNGRAEM